MKHRKTVHRRYRKPPLRGGTLRYRTNTTKQRRVTSAVHICNARSSSCVRVVHAECSGIRLLARVLRLQPQSSSSRLQVRLSSTGSRADDCAILALSPLVLMRSRASFLGCFLYVLRLFSVKMLKFPSRGSAPHPAGAPPQTPLYTITPVTVTASS